MAQQAVEETYERKLYWEIKNQMEDEGVRFNVESVEEAEEKLSMAVDYVKDVYCDDGEEITDAVSNWLGDARFEYPEEFAATGAKVPEKV